MEENKGAKKSAIFAIIAAIIGVAILFGGFWYYTNSTSKKQSPNNTPVEDNNGGEDIGDINEEPQEIKSCFVGDVDPVINKEDYDEEDEYEYESDKEFVDTVKNNCSCINKNAKAFSGTIDASTKNSLKNAIFEKYNYTAKDEEEFKEGFEPELGKTKFVYTTYICSNNPSGGSNCGNAAAVLVNGKWDIELQGSGAISEDLERTVIERVINGYCK